MLQDKLEDIAALKLRYTRGMCRQEYKRQQDAVQAQLRRMELVHGEEFIVNDFTEWCSTDEAARASYPFDVYFARFDNRMRGLTDQSFGRPNEKLQKAIEWLTEYLQDGEIHFSAAIRFDAKNGAGITLDTLDRAKEMLPIKVFKQGNKWYWQIIPTGEAAKPDLEGLDDPTSLLTFGDRRSGSQA
jgi:hypothetical protein